MKNLFLLFISMFFMLSCGGEPDQPFDNTIVPASKYIRYNIFDYQVTNRLSRIQEQAAPAEDRSSWETTVDDIRDKFEGQLGEDFEIPSKIAAGAADIDLRFQDDGTLLGKFEMPFRGDSIKIDLQVRPNEETGLIEDTIFVNQLPRVEITHDFDLTTAKAFILNSNQDKKFSVDFERTDDTITVKFLNLFNNNAFNIVIDKEILFIERDVNDDGFGTNNFELQLRINTKDFAGRFDIIVPFLGHLNFCFGSGDLASVNCE